jgi:hypothetical protein
MVQDDAKYDEEAVNQAWNQHLTGIHLTPSQQSSWQSTSKLAKSAVSPGFSCHAGHAGVIYIALLFVLMIFIPSVPALNPVLPEMAKSDPFLTRQAKNDLVRRECLQHFSS